MTTFKCLKSVVGKGIRLSGAPLPADRFSWQRESTSTPQHAPESEHTGTAARHVLRVQKTGIWNCLEVGPDALWTLTSSEN